MKMYNKLVRDRIPEIIEANGETPITQKITNGWELRNHLRIKLEEEVREYLRTDHIDASLQELADVLEVVYALARLDQADESDLEVIRAKKANKNGKFDNGVYLIGVE